MRWRLTWCSALVGALAGCGTELTGGTPEGSATLVSDVWRLCRPAPELVLIALDDSPTAQGRTLRALVAERFVTTFERGIHLPTQSCTSTDPAIWMPYDRYAVIVSPSRAPGAEQASPGTNEALVLRTERETPEAEAAWTTAVGTAIIGAESEGLGPFRLLEAQARWARLLLGREEPASDSERAAIDALPVEGTLRVFAGSARDDESAGDPSEHLLEPEQGDRLFVDWPRAITPDPTFVYCGPGRTPRLDAWAGGIGARSDPCEGHEVFDATWVADCFPKCSDRRPIVDADGKARCRIAVTTDLAPCDPALGWLNPVAPDGVRRALEVVRDGVRLRQCDVIELEGAALDSCRHDWDCAGCEAGYCVTELPGTYDVCTGAGALWPLRFPRGTLTARPAWLDITCEVEPIPG